MFLRFEQVIPPAAMQILREKVLNGPFEEGKLTADGLAAAAKNNLQLNPASREAIEGARFLIEEIFKNALFRNAAMPAAVSVPGFSRYLPGMTYGQHLDAPVMNGAERRQIRTDLAVTVFLSPPDSYQGGELVIDTGTGQEICKGAVGDCVLYPATYVHWVEPVRSGERAVSFFWIQSMIRSEPGRRIAFELARIIDKIDRNGDTQGVLMPLMKCHANLLRLFLEP